MAPKRKYRNANKRLSSLKMKKLSDKLGSQWNKEEVERFYEAYRNYGKDWKKVAADVRSRSVEMVQTLYNMNQVYLSLPEGIASVDGLIAKMTDRGIVLEKSDSERTVTEESERESSDSSSSQKPVKRKRGKIQLNVSKESFQSPLIASNEGFHSQLKRSGVNGNHPRAVGKRTPRIPVKYSFRKDDCDANDDKVAHVAAQRGGLQCSGTKGGLNFCLKEKVDIETTNPKPKQCRGRPPKKRRNKIGETVGNLLLDDGGGACSGTKRGLHFCLKEKVDIEATNPKPKHPLRDRPLALYHLESSVQLKEERMTVDNDEKFALPESTSTRQNKDEVKLPPDLNQKILSTVHGVDVSTFNKSFKEKLSSCLSSYMVRRWCVFEWFYSPIDYPWFSKREFSEYLNHVGLGNITRLTRVEWSVIKSSLGKPRRFCERFIREERQKLEQYRRSVREYYTEIRDGMRDGLPTDLPQPFYVGQLVIVLHPKTGEIHDGIVLEVDRDKSRVQFDHPRLGVEVFMDIDCMPLNPFDNMPETLRMQISADKSPCMSEEPQMKGSSIQPAEKEKLLMELKNANNDTIENQNDTYCFMDSEEFVEHYAIGETPSKFQCS